MAFLMISMMFIWVPRAAVSAKRIAEVLESRNSIVDPLQPQSFDKEKRGVVEFKEMSFRYKGAAEDALHEISFTALPGQTTAIIGATGAGKTTLVNALMRFYDVSSGSVLVGGVDVRDVLQRDLRSLIAYCPQKSSLFSGTIASNIRYGKKDATDDEVERAAATAQALEFIDEKRFEREIAQAGANVSGGQKQRLAIARALLKQSEIIIFDDSFSALDFKTDSLLRQALKQYAKNSTLIIIAQRISTIMQAENIIVLDRGRIAGAGTHQSLLKTCPEYAEIASLQLAQEEVV
jgi:ATP-binding cassette subfamily B protein